MLHVYALRQEKGFKGIFIKNAYFTILRIYIILKLISENGSRLTKLRFLGLSKCRSKDTVKVSAHSFKQFTSRLLKLSFSLSMHLYNTDGRHA